MQSMLLLRSAVLGGGHGADGAEGLEELPEHRLVGRLVEVLDLGVIVTTPRITVA